MSRFIDTAFSAHALSRSGRSYTGYRASSHTHMHDISAELMALIAAVHANDPVIESMEGTSAAQAGVSPLVLKILADHGARTGVAIRYRLNDPDGELFKTDDTGTTLPGYVSPGKFLPFLSKRAVSDARRTSHATEEADIAKELKACALLGIERNFPKYEGASGYGAAVRTDVGDIYFGGQYSAFDQRLGVHAEMGVISRALSEGARAITHIGIVSSKFPDSPASPCGCCRQIIAEVARETARAPRIYLFASRTEEMQSFALDELFPVQWTNEKWHPRDHSFP